MPPPLKDEVQEVTPKSGDEVPAPKDAVVDVPIDLEEVAQAKVNQHQAQAYALINQSMTLLVEVKDAKGMADLLREAFARFDDAGCQPAVTDGPGRTYNVGFYDVKLTGRW